MEENNALIEEEEEERVVGTDATSPLRSTSMFCPACKSLDVKAKTSPVEKDNKLMVVYQCNFCGCVWEVYSQPIMSGDEPLSKRG